MRRYECEQNDERRDSRGVLAEFVIALLALVLMFVFTGCAKDGQASAGDQAAGQQAAVEDAACEAFSAANPATPSTAGALQVVGTQLSAEDGRAVQLRGVSTHGLSWYPEYVNQEFFDELRRASQRLERECGASGHVYG